MIPSLTQAYLTNCLEQSGTSLPTAVTAVIPGEMTESFIRFEALFPPDTPATIPRRYLVKTNLKGYPHAQAEAAFYRDIASRVEDAPIPQTIDVGYDENAEHAYITQADLSDSHTAAITDTRDPTVERLGAIVDEIAKVHAACWDQPWISEGLFVDSRNDICDMAQASSTDVLTESCTRIAESDLRRIFKVSSDLDPSWQSVCRDAMLSWPALTADRYAQGHLTLIHADLHPWNVLVPDDDIGAPVILDWELVCRGLGVFDVAYMILRCRLSPEQRRTFEDALIPRYHDRLLSLGVQSYDLQRCREDYRLSIIANIRPPLSWIRPLNLISTMEAFFDWDCEALTSHA